MISSAAEDIPTCIEHQPDRQFVVGTIARLQTYVEVLDAVGWQESSEAPHDQEVTVDHQLASWAREQALEVGESLAHLPVDDRQLDVLHALRLLGGQEAVADWP